MISVTSAALEDSSSSLVTSPWPNLTLATSSSDMIPSMSTTVDHQALSGESGTLFNGMNVLLSSANVEGPQDRMGAYYIGHSHGLRYSESSCKQQQDSSVNSMFDSAGHHHLHNHIPMNASNQIPDVTLSSSLQRHLFLTTTSQSYGFGSEVSPLRRSSDLGLVATDPKNILLLLPDTAHRQDVKSSHNSIADENVIKFTSVSPHQDVIPTLAGIDVTANLPSSDMDDVVDLVSPSFGGACSLTQKMKSGGGELVNYRYSEPSSFTSPVRLMPDYGNTARSTPPSVRLVPASQQELLPQQQSFLSASSQAVRLMPAKQNSTILLTPEFTRRSPFPKPAPRLDKDARVTEKAPKKKEQGVKQSGRKRNRIETISCFKCTVCGFLGSTISSVEKHMNLEHDADLAWDDDNDDWVNTAQREGICLECPSCPNRFSAEGSRSFRVHVMDDHGVSEEEAEAQFKRCAAQRKDTTLALLKKRRQEEREARKKSAKEILEAYVDVSGELRVRSVRDRGRGAAETVHMDVTAGEYAEAMSIAKKLDKTAKKNGGSDGETRIPFASQKLLVQNLSVKPSCSQSAEDVSVDVKQHDGDGFSAAVTERRKRARAGRPRGSRSLGITKLRKLNPCIVLSEERLGSECGVSECAVRLHDIEKLDYHRRSHNPPPKTGFACLECQTQFEQWPSLTLHLWRCHRLDMELYACESCDTFRSFTMARLESHRLTHRCERPFLCDDCGRGFKTQKNLRNHKLLLHPATTVATVTTQGDPKESEVPTGSTCTDCNRKFRELRLLKMHISNVHEKLKPHLCNFCGYSASSKSSLKLHLRLHTGEKPYGCDECEYRTADHNSLRRHRMRHSGEKPYKCPVTDCLYSSIQSSTFKIHLKSKHPKLSDKLVYNCQLCHFQTLQEGNYLTHMAEHRGGKETTAIRGIAAAQGVKAEDEPDANQAEKSSENSKSIAVLC